MSTSIVLLCLVSCGARAQLRTERGEPAAAEGAAAAAQLPADWRTLSPIAFERWVASELAAGTPRAWSERDGAQLSGALDELGSSGVRAAVILGRSRTRAAAELLLAHLEQRVLHDELYGDAADVVAAHALLNFSHAHELAARLAALSAGPEPHPDLEVRVECAASALALGSDAGVPFLLRVLLLGTPASQAGALDFQPSPTTAWARGRASQALADHVGMPNPYRADAALAARVDAVRALREALPR